MVAALPATAWTSSSHVRATVMPGGHGGGDGGSGGIAGGGEDDELVF